ncbi:hypothetical protein QFC21_002262 [Naganishia friedmannii]|uniref:Uncharacterized protein n=1 Tax=Naganishia friedmannii TaxID=89922 RepID=A0ACC2VY45_9TREE|nr:hypothetical protein QFC21_002262 [Naganishia friedmannii]
MFPNEYPFKPPDIKLFTPSGRFETNIKICMSMTSYHPSTWNAAWSVATILTGLLSFMLTDEITTGAVKTTEAEKKRFAAASHGFNLANKKFRDVFPEYATPELTDLPDMGNGPTTGKAGGAGSNQTEPSSSTAPHRTTNTSSSGIEIRTDTCSGSESLGGSGMMDAVAYARARAADEARVQQEIGGAETSATIPSSQTGSAISTTTMAHAGAAGTIQPQLQQLQQKRRESWFSRWRWVLAAVAVIVLGRISSF